ncbi:MAG TPA: PHP domain-containing protein [Ktedonobacterales bacterium]|nr:PHP domain-containing protein [Ktedonobacterales bacterium]
MSIATDFHSHVSRTSADVMVQAARDKELRVFGLSEHIFQMSEMRPTLGHMRLEGPPLSFAAYREGVQEAAERAQLDARLGLEVDFIPGKNEQIHEAIQRYQWDFLIGSIHEVDGLFFEDEDLRWDREEGEALWLRYLVLLREAVNSGYFQVVSHPVRMARQNPHVPASLDEHLEHLAADATARNVALELNGYDMRTYPHLVRRVARACARHGTPISVSSDAHRPQDIAGKHAETEAIMREAGLTHIRTWKQGTPSDTPI